MIFWSAFCSFLALGFATESTGLFAHELNAALAVVLLLVAALLDPARPVDGNGSALVSPSDGRREGRPLYGRWLGLIACAAGLVLLPGRLELRLFAAGLWFWGLHAFAVSRGRRQPLAATLSLACVLTGVLVFAESQSLLGWYAARPISSLASALGSAVSGAPMTLGPTYNGIWTLILAVCAGAVGWARSSRRPAAFILFLLAVAFIYPSFLSLYTKAPDWKERLTAPAATAAGVAPAKPADAPGSDLEAGAKSSAAWERFNSGLSAVGGWLARGALRAYPNHLTLALVVLLAVPLAVLLAALERGGVKRISGPSTVGPAMDSRNGPGEPARGAGPNQGRGHPPTVHGLAAGVRKEPAVAIAVLALLAGWALTNFPAAPRPAPLKVALYKEGFLNWMTPNHQMYGSRSAGMFGNLPLLCERMGWRAEIIPNIDRETLADFDLLCLMNLKDPLPPDAPQAIWEFVERGGSLLSLGDHTFYKHDGRLIINDPIRPANIRYAFDSAYYFIGGWLHSIRYRPHPTTAGLADRTNEAGCVVGASLDIRYPAAPVIIGKWGWSDPGDDAAVQQGYMGNSRFDRGEPLGDLVLVAAQNVGRGRVIVVGDTSGFVNAIQAQTWPFTHRVFWWLGGGGRAGLPFWRDVLGLGLLAAVFALVLRSTQPSTSRRGYPGGMSPTRPPTDDTVDAARRAASNAGTTIERGGARIFFALPVAAAALYLAGWASNRALASLHSPPALSGRVACVDLSHVGLHSVEGWRDNGISGVYLNLMREGFFAIGLPSFDDRQIFASDLFVTIAPTRPYAPGEVDALRRFLEGGGTVLAAVGYEQRAGAQTLLDLGGLRLANRPLGRSATYVPGAPVVPQFWNAWPVLGGDAMVTLRNEPVIVQKRIGRGRLVVVGDTHFFFNRNLETEDGGNVANIRFFGWLMQQIVPPPAQPAPADTPGGPPS